MKNLVKKLKYLSFSASALILLAAPVAQARYTDGLWWGNCSGRTTLASVAWGTSRLTVYRCSNGYVFSNVNSSRYASKNAQIWRYHPWYRNMLASGTAYSVTTNMLGLVNGHCYTARGWTQENGSRQFSFCW